MYTDISKMVEWVHRRIYLTLKPQVLDMVKNPVRERKLSVQLPDWSYWETFMCVPKGMRVGGELLYLFLERLYMKKHNFLSSFGMRLSRKHYLIGLIIVSIVPAFINAFFPENISLFRVIIGYIAFFLNLYLITRRFHDLNRSVTAYLVYILIREIVEGIALLSNLNFDFSFILSTFLLMDVAIGIYLLTTKGDETSNQYGAPTTGLPWKEALFGNKHKLNV